MAERWSGIHAEVAGVAKAVRNLEGEPEPIARYVYERACAYVGADHEGATVALIISALFETKQMAVEEAGRAVIERLSNG